MSAPVFWRLRYADGRERSEDPDDTTSIRNVRPGAVELQVIRTADGKPLCRIDLAGYVPIWYRRRSLDLSDQSGARHEYTVFGRVRPVPIVGSDVLLDGTCWIIRGGRVENCPAELIDRPMIAALVEGAGGR